MLLTSATRSSSFSLSGALRSLWLSLLLLRTCLGNTTAAAVLRYFCVDCLVRNQLQTCAVAKSLTSLISRCRSVLPVTLSLSYTLSCFFLVQNRIHSHSFGFVFQFRCETNLRNIPQQQRQRHMKKYVKADNAAYAKYFLSVFYECEKNRKIILRFFGHKFRFPRSVLLLVLLLLLLLLFTMYNE